MSKQLPFIIFTYAHPTRIKSTRLGAYDKCEYYTSTERLVPIAEIQVIQFSLPTVGVTLTMRHPPGIKVETSLEHIDGATPECPEGEIEGEVSRWKSDRAFLDNEHLWVMYERRPIEAQKVPPLTPPIATVAPVRKAIEGEKLTVESQDRVPPRSS